MVVVSHAFIKILFEKRNNKQTKKKTNKKKLKTKCKTEKKSIKQPSQSTNREYISQQLHDQF